MSNAYLTRWLAAAALVIASLVLVAQEARTPLERRIAHRELLTRIFEQVVFYWERGPEIPVVRKWIRQQPILIYLQGDVQPPYRDFVIDYTEKLSHLTGLTFELTPTLNHDSRVTLVRIHFGPRTDIESVLKHYRVLRDVEFLKRTNSACVAIGEANSQGTLRRTFIFITTDRDLDWLRSCLLEELTQSLGLPNDVDLILPTIFSDRSDPTELTLNDQILVRTLYDDRLTPGMPRVEAMKIARQVIAKLHAAVRAEGPAALIHPRHKARTAGGTRPN